jgi:hypothetical protein
VSLAPTSKAHVQIVLLSSLDLEYPQAHNWDGRMPLFAYIPPAVSVRLNQANGGLSKLDVYVSNPVQLSFILCKTYAVESPTSHHQLPQQCTGYPGVVVGGSILVG